MFHPPVIQTLHYSSHPYGLGTFADSAAVALLSDSLIIDKTLQYHAWDNWLGLRDVLVFVPVLKNSKLVAGETDAVCKSFEIFHFHVFTGHVSHCHKMLSVYSEGLIFSFFFSYPNAHLGFKFRFVSIVCGGSHSSRSDFPNGLVVSNWNYLWAWWMISKCLSSSRKSPCAFNT